MPEYDVHLEIIEIYGTGKCPSEYKIGDKFSIDDPNLCQWAKNSLLPFSTALRFGGEAPWKKENKDTFNISCPDGNNPVVFKLTRTLKV